MAKKILKYVRNGVAWGWGWMMVACLIADLAGFDALLDLAFEHFAANMLASTLTGMGFGTSAIVYTSARLRLWQKMLIHFGVGMGIFLPIALTMHWLPSESLGMVLVSILISILVFALIWSGFYLYYRLEAKKINERLKAQRSEGE